MSTLLHMQKNDEGNMNHGFNLYMLNCDIISLHLNVPYSS